jgi:flavorubredoxin
MDHSLIRIRQAERLGGQRCSLERNEGTTTIKERNKWDRDAVVQKQMVSLSPSDLAFYNLELLHRAETLVNFLEDNVGEHIEFPIRIRAHNYQARKYYDEVVEDLKILVSMLLEG